MSNRTKKARANALREAAGTGSASNKHITRISAKPSADRKENKPSEHTEKINHIKATSGNIVAEDVLNSELVTAPAADAKTTKTPENTANSTKNLTKTDQKSKNNLKKSQKDEHGEKPLKEVFILARPFVALGRYLRDSWREIRQVRWPNRSNTWKMTAAVLAYCALFIIFIMLLDTLFTFLFNLLLK